MIWNNSNGFGLIIKILRTWMNRSRSSGSIRCGFRVSTLTLWWWRGAVAKNWWRPRRPFSGRTQRDTERLNNGRPRRPEKTPQTQHKPNSTTRNIFRTRVQLNEKLIDHGPKIYIFTVFTKEFGSKYFPWGLLLNQWADLDVYFKANLSLSKELMRTGIKLDTRKRPWIRAGSFCEPDEYANIYKFPLVSCLKSELNL